MHEADNRLTEASELDLTNPFTTARARAAGITPAQLRGPRFRRLAKGVYVEATTAPTRLQSVQAALLTHPPTAFASHTSAAEAYRIPVPHHPEVHVSVHDPGDRRRRPGVRCHVASADTPVLTFSGLRLSTPAQTFVELASMLGLVDLVVAGDDIVRKRWYTPEQLVAYCEASTDRHAGRALEAARYVRAEVDSPMETRLRMLLVLAGFPEPQVNFTVRDEYGAVLMRFDLSYPEVRVIVEYDGRQHADDHVQYDRDIERREEIDGRKWRIVVVTAPGIYTDPERTLTRVRHVLVERGLPGVPRRFDDEWRTHFPARSGWPVATRRP
jgi:very-short-patch-repair endonuclease